MSGCRADTPGHQRDTCPCQGWGLLCQDPIFNPGPLGPLCGRWFRPGSRVEVWVTEDGKG